MIRGELYRISALRTTTLCVVSAQPLLDNPIYTMIYAVGLTEDDPQHVLAVAVTEPAAGWLDVGRNLGRYARTWFTDPPLGRLATDALGQVDSALRVALEL